jgi:hypothetical protein
MYSIPFTLCNYYEKVNIYDFYDNGYSEESILPLIEILIKKYDDIEIQKEHISLIIRNNFRKCFELFHQFLPIIKNEYYDICHYGHLELLKYLCEIDENKENIIDNELMDIAVFNNNSLNIFKFLINKGNIITNEIIIDIVLYDSCDLLSYIYDDIKNRPNFDINILYELTGYSDDSECLSFLYKKENGII